MGGVCAGSGWLATTGERGEEIWERGGEGGEGGRKKKEPRRGARARAAAAVLLASYSRTFHLSLHVVFGCLAPMEALTTTLTYLS